MQRLFQQSPIESKESKGWVVAEETKSTLINEARCMHIGPNQTIVFRGERLGTIYLYNPFQHKCFKITYDKDLCTIGDMLLTYNYKNGARVGIELQEIQHSSKQTLTRRVGLIENHGLELEKSAKLSSSQLVVTDGHSICLYDVNSSLAKRNSVISQRDLRSHLVSKEKQGDYDVSVLSIRGHKGRLAVLLLHQGSSQHVYFQEWKQTKKMQWTCEAAKSITLLYEGRNDPLDDLRQCSKLYRLTDNELVIELPYDLLYVNLTEDSIKQTKCRSASYVHQLPHNMSYFLHFCNKEILLIDPKQSIIHSYPHADNIRSILVTENGCVMIVTASNVTFYKIHFLTQLAETLADCSKTDFFQNLEKSPSIIGGYLGYNGKAPFWLEEVTPEVALEKAPEQRIRALCR